jgi:hypothetical protein
MANARQIRFRQELRKLIAAGMPVKKAMGEAWKRTPKKNPKPRRRR